MVERNDRGHWFWRRKVKSTASIGSAYLSCSQVRALGHFSRDGYRIHARSMVTRSNGSPELA